MGVVYQLRMSRADWKTFPPPFLKTRLTTVKSKVSNPTGDDRDSCWVGFTWFESAGYMLRCCSISKSPHAINSISVTVPFRWITMGQYLITETNFPAAPKPSQSQLRPPRSSHLTLLSHHQAFYVHSMDTTEEKPDRKSPWTHTMTPRLTYTQIRLTLKTNIRLGIILICWLECCRFPFTWPFLFFFGKGQRLSRKPASFLAD